MIFTASPSDVAPPIEAAVLKCGTGLAHLGSHGSPAATQPTP
jgi:hypothetical protein